MKRRLSSEGADALRRVRLSAIQIVLEAASIQRIAEAEFRVSTADVARRSGIREYLVRRIGVDHFTAIEVAGRVIGYQRGEFYVADNEDQERRRLIRDWNASHCPPLTAFLAAAVAQANEEDRG